MLSIALLVALGTPPLKPGRYEESLDEAKLKRPYILNIPKQADGKAKLPLVVVLHDWTGSAVAAESYTQMELKSTKAGFVAAFPEGTARGWNTGFKNLGADGAEDVNFIDHVISDVARQTPIDPKRIFLVGHGNGGMMAYVAGARLAQRVAAIGVVEGTLGFDRGEAKGEAPRPATPVSAIIIHGKLDPNVPYDHGSGLPQPALMPNAMSAIDSATEWARFDAITNLPKTLDSKNPNVQILDWRGANVEVELITILNGTHAWPGGIGISGPEVKSGINAADIIWTFLVAHPKS